jgi:cell wall-associated NlpC family hydrolase
VVAAALLASLCAPVALTASGAQGKSATTLRQEAARILAQINANGDRISALDEEINTAHIKLASLHSQIHRTNLQIASAQRTIGSLHTDVVSRAAALYRGAGGAADIGAQTASTVQAQSAMQVYSQAASAQDQQRIDKYRNARDDRARAKTRLAAAESAEQQQLSSLQAQQRQILGLSRQEQALYNQKNSQLAAEVKLEQQQAIDAARRAAAAKARAAAAAAAAASAQRSSGGGGGLDTNTGVAPGPIPAPSSGAAAAVAAAESRLGDPYVYATAGPNTFDCSGLTMWAWAHAGVYMAHSAEAQYYEFPHVPVGDAQPGDLVAFGSPIHHIGMVVGGGQMIEAPHSGAVVRYASYFRSDLVGVARP